MLRNFFRKSFSSTVITKPQTLEEYYAERPTLQPGDLNAQVGHFNVFRIGEQPAGEAHPVAFGRKDYFKICLTTGRSRIHYADKTINIEKHALLFANPLVPYNWEPLEPEQTGFSCIFTESFFNNYGRLKDYPVFKPGGLPVYDLTSDEVAAMMTIFSSMADELNSDFEFKNDVLRNLVFQLIHNTLKMRPAVSVQPEKLTAATRISSLFLDLLERQFPLENNIQRVTLRSASDFANQLAIHVNHLNKSVKEATQKTTSELIMERLLKEAKILLKHSSWNISEIAYALGFEGPTHFSSFFKKYLSLTPSQFRNA